MSVDKFGTYRMKQAMPTPPRQDPSWKTCVQLVTWQLHLARNPLLISPLIVHSWQNCLLLLTHPSLCQKQQRIHWLELDLQLGKAQHSMIKTSTTLHKQNLVEMLDNKSQCVTSPKKQVQAHLCRFLSVSGRMLLGLSVALPLVMYMEPLSSFVTVESRIQKIPLMIWPVPDTIALATEFL